MDASSLTVSVATHAGRPAVEAGKTRVGAEPRTDDRVGIVLVALALA